MHRHAHKAGSHGKMAGHGGKGPQLTGTTANQLNQEELARVQAGNFSNPSAPPGPRLAPPPPPGPRRPPPGGKGNTATELPRSPNTRQPPPRPPVRCPPPTPSP